MDKDLKKDVEVLWNYLCLNSEDIKSECIIGLGSILQIVPEKCSYLFKNGYGKYIIFSGNCGKGTDGVIAKTEAEIFKDCALNLGVPSDKVLIEMKATNTYENFKYIKEVLENNNYSPASFLIVGKPYQERRAQAIASIELAGKKFSISSFKMSLDDFLDYVEYSNCMTIEDVINELVAEINIALIVPTYGLQAYEEVPNNVLESYKRLVNKGFSRYLINDDIIKGILKEWKNKALR